MCVGEQHFLQLIAAVQWNENNHEGETEGNRVVGEKHKDCLFKKAKE